MILKEQIKIARLIASGTPRELAINEVAVTSSMEKSSPPYDMKKGKDYVVVNDKEKSAQQQSIEKDRKRKAIQKEKNAAITSSNQKKSLVTTGDSRSTDKPASMDKRKDPRYKSVVLPAARRAASKVTSKTSDVIKKAKFSKINTTAVTTDGDKGATAAQQATGNLAKAGVATTKNVAKGTAKAARLGVKAGGKAVGFVGKLLARRKELNQDKPKTGRFSQFRKEEFIQEVEDKKDSKAKKVIDIMKGKNPIKINPDVKEDTVVVQDASGKDFVEIVDIITPEKIRSDWRKEINVTEAAAWTRKAGKSKSGGLNEKGRKSYERQNPGSDLKAPSKKVGNPRRKSFCARMKGMKKKLTSAKTARDPDSRINKSLRAWNC